MGCCDGLGKVAITVRVLMTAFNIIFTVAGVALLVGGVILKVDYSIVGSFIDPLLNDVTGGTDSQMALGGVIDTAAYTCIGIGCFIFVTGFLGCVGALIRSVAMLDFFSSMVILALLAELVLTILIFAWTDGLETNLRTYLNDTILNEFEALSVNGTQYFQNVMKLPPITIAWNALQLKFNCCGLNGGSDYAYATKWNRSAVLSLLPNYTPTTLVLSTPISCCKTMGQFPDIQLNSTNLTCAVQPNSNNSNYDVGCYDTIKAVILEQKDGIIGVTIGVGIIEILAVVFACFLCTAFNKAKKQVSPREKTSKKKSSKKNKKDSFKDEAIV